MSRLCDERSARFEAHLLGGEAFGVGDQWWIWIGDRDSGNDHAVLDINTPEGQLAAMELLRPILLPCRDHDGAWHEPVSNTISATLPEAIAAAWNSAVEKWEKEHSEALN